MCIRDSRTIWDMIQEQINDPMIFILFLAASISLLLREFSDTGIILAVIVLNTAIAVSYTHLSPQVLIFKMFPNVEPYISPFLLLEHGI